MLMSNLLCGVVPWFGGHPDNLRGTVDSMRTVCDEVLVVHQSLFDADREVARSIADKVEVVDWNYVYQEEGYGGLPNRHGQSSCDWFLLLGVGETVAEQYRPLRDTLRNSPRNVVWRCNHRNADGKMDSNTWGRLWCPSGGVRWGGLIHEEAGNGTPGPHILFRMLDTDKVPHHDPLVQEALRWLKLTSYDQNYYRLLKSIDPQTGDSPLRSFTNKGWISFVQGSADAREANQVKWGDLIQPALRGDRDAFLEAVKWRMEHNDQPKGCNFEPLGKPMTPGS